MMNSEKFYDIIIPVGKKDVNFVPRVVNLITRCLSDVEHIYILTNQKYIVGISRKLRAYSQCVVLDENNLIEGLSFEGVKNLISRHAPQHVSITGWYFQQFLKLGFALSKYSKEYYLSWDADTLPLAPITFFENDKILYNPKSENHVNYYSTMERLLGFGRIVDHSFISESMMFSSKIVREMITDIEKAPIEGEDWISKIINACDMEQSVQAFSEFETYGNYCAKYYPGLYKPRHLNTFREAGLIRGRYISEKLLRKMSFDLDMASFEMQNRPSFPYNIPNVIWMLKKKIANLRTMNFRDIQEKMSDKQSGEKVIEEGFYRLPERPSGKSVASASAWRRDRK